MNRAAGGVMKSEDFLSRYAPFVAALLLAAFVIQAVTSMRYKNVTTDEIMYIGAGYYHWETGDFALNMTNPPLMKLIAALPLRALDARMPEIDSPPAKWPQWKQWEFSRRFLYDNTVDADRLLFWARVPIVLLGVILGVYVFRWSRALYGDGAGLLSLLLYSFSPNMLAHAQIAAHDFGLTVLMFIASYYFWRFMKVPGLLPLGLCGLFAGLAFLTKTTAAFLAPVFGLYVLLCVVFRAECGVYAALPIVRRMAADRIRKRQILTAVFSFVVILGVVLIVLNAGYAFQGFPAVFGGPQSPPLVAGIPLPLPAPFAELIKFQARQTAHAGGTYFAGVLYEHGLWYLMFVAVLLKTPIGGLVLFAVGAAGLARRFAVRADEWLPVVFIVVLMAIFSYLSEINIGLRYVLPIYPFAHILMGRVWRSGKARSRVWQVVVGGLALWYAGSGVWCYPHYLAYFNESIGGPANGYKYLADSNVDWGQDLKGLKAYMDKRGWDRIGLAYFGSADAAYYGIDYDFYPSVGLAPREAGQQWWYEEGAACEEAVPRPTGPFAISVTLRAHPGWMNELFGKCYAWLDDYEPVDQVGHSILIYEID